MGKLVFYRQARADGGVRTGVDGDDTPLLHEFQRGSEELDPAILWYVRAYLAKLRLLDKGKIIDRDWTEAKRLAERVPRDGKPRHLGDCLIKAIANRFGYEVLSGDQGFPI